MDNNKKVETRKSEKNEGGMVIDLNLHIAVVNWIQWSALSERQNQRMCHYHFMHDTKVSRNSI